MPDAPNWFDHLDNNALISHISALYVEIKAAEHELWRRTAVLLALFPKGWREPPKGTVFGEDASARYEEALEAFMVSALEQRQCRPDAAGGSWIAAYPWTEVWGPQGCLGPVPLRTIRELIRSGHEHAQASLAEHGSGDSEPWR